MLLLLYKTVYVDSPNAMQSFTTGVGKEQNTMMHDTTQHNKQKQQRKITNKWKGSTATQLKHSNYESFLNTMPLHSPYTKTLHSGPKAPDNMLAPEPQYKLETDTGYKKIEVYFNKTKIGAMVNAKHKKP